MIDELKDVFELATGAAAFVNELLKMKPKNKKDFSNKDNSTLAASGSYSKLAASGSDSTLAASGSDSTLAASGSDSTLAASGSYSTLAASGWNSTLAASGSDSTLAASGSYSKLEIMGENSIGAAVGRKSIVKGIKGNWITLAEYKQNEYNKWIVDFVKTEQIDGERIKEDTYYTLYNHEFTEVQIIDNVKTIILKRKNTVIHGLYFDSLEPCYVVEKDGIYSHGATIKEAKESLIYKLSDRDTSKYKDYTLDTVITFEEAIKMYRCITGACEGGTRNFVENILPSKGKKKKKYTISEVIQLTEGQYNNDKLKEFFNT